MNPRWLLLAVSVICLLTVLPTAALSQGASVSAGCGTPTIDGHAWSIEWANAGKVDLIPAVIPPSSQAVSPIPLPDVETSQLDEASGEMWVMHDESYFYLAGSLVLDHATLHPDWWVGRITIQFTDEGDPLDGEWDALDCGPPLPGEGDVASLEEGDALGGTSGDYFGPHSQLATCDPQPLVGVEWEAEGGTPIVFEHAFNLTTSELDKVGPGDCFRLGLTLSGLGCEWGSGCGDGGDWLKGYAAWPTGWGPMPSICGVVCLEPCEEGFVPEPSSILLLGSGLAGLAGYATLRWRARE
jgi:hypothetical protein